MGTKLSLDSLIKLIGLVAVQLTRTVEFLAISGGLLQIKISIWIFYALYMYHFEKLSSQYSLSIRVDSQTASCLI